MEATVSRKSDAATASELSPQAGTETGDSSHWRSVRDTGPFSAWRAPPGFFMGLTVVVLFVGVFFVGLSQLMQAMT